MIGLDDYHAYESTKSDGGGSGGFGCFGSSFIWIVVAIGILWVIGKLFV